MLINNRALRKAEIFKTNFALKILVAKYPPEALKNNAGIVAIPNIHIPRPASSELVIVAASANAL